MDHPQQYREFRDNKAEGQPEDVKSPVPASAPAPEASEPQVQGPQSAEATEASAVEPPGGQTPASEPVGEPTESPVHDQAHCQSCGACQGAAGEGEAAGALSGPVGESVEEAAGEDNESEPLICVRYGRMNGLGLFRSKIGKVFRGAQVVIKSDRGLEIGEVLRDATPGLCYEGRPLKRVGTIRRPATHDDLMEDKHLRQGEDGQRRYCEERIRERKLPMKIAAVEHLFGGDRLVFYFLAEGRVDFRDLVKDLAHEYQTRIEMRQIGVRDEARLLADYERCGQFICCRAFIKEFQPVSMRMAKVQKATLDPSKISGRCGRLMCCLRYENEVYDDLRKNLPRRNSYVMTEHGPARVIGGDILTQLVKVDVKGKYVVIPIAEITARDIPEKEALAAIAASTPAPRRDYGANRRSASPTRRPAPAQAAEPRESGNAAEGEPVEELQDLAVPGELTEAPEAAVEATAPAEVAPGGGPQQPGGGQQPGGSGEPGKRRRRSRHRRGRGHGGAAGAIQPGQPQQAGGQAGGEQRPPTERSNQQRDRGPADQSRQQGQRPPADRGRQPDRGRRDLGVPRAVLESLGAFDDEPPSGGGEQSADQEQTPQGGHQPVDRSAGTPGGGGNQPSGGAAPGGQHHQGQRGRRRGRRGQRRGGPGSQGGPPSSPGGGPPPNQGGTPPRPAGDPQAG
jgi:cell fate regulator YaaT (PSP1 superfamily)